MSGHEDLQRDGAPAGSEGRSAVEELDGPAHGHDEPPFVACLSVCGLCSRAECDLRQASAPSVGEGCGWRLKPQCAPTSVAQVVGSAIFVRAAPMALSRATI